MSKSLRLYTLAQNSLMQYQDEWLPRECVSRLAEEYLGTMCYQMEGSSFLEELETAAHELVERQQAMTGIDLGDIGRASCAERYYADLLALNALKQAQADIEWADEHFSEHINECVYLEPEHKSWTESWKQWEEAQDEREPLWARLTKQYLLDGYYLTLGTERYDCRKALDALGLDELPERAGDVADGSLGYGTAIQEKAVALGLTYEWEGPYAIELEDSTAYEAYLLDRMEEQERHGDQEGHGAR